MNFVSRLFDEAKVLLEVRRGSSANLRENLEKYTVLCQKIWSDLLGEFQLPGNFDGFCDNLNFFCLRFRYCLIFLCYGSGLASVQIRIWIRIWQEPNQCGSWSWLGYVVVTKVDFFYVFLYFEQVRWCFTNNHVGAAFLNCWRSGLFVHFFMFIVVGSGSRRAKSMRIRIENAALKKVLNFFLAFNMFPVFCREPSLLLRPAHPSSLEIRLFPLLHRGGERIALPTVHYFLLQPLEGHLALHGISASQEPGRYQGQTLFHSFYFFRHQIIK